MTIAMMLLVVAMFTITSLNDKYAVSKAKMNGYEMTFLMAAGTVVFMSAMLPFLKAEDRFFTFCPQTIIAILLIALCKLLEFAMSAKILVDMSVFELKAWLGITLFMSYFTDIFRGEQLKALKLIFIAVTAVGLILVAVAGRKKVNYKRIAIPLILYLLQSYGYGFIITGAEQYVSSTMTLYLALVVLALGLIPLAKPWAIAKRSPEGKKGVCLVLASKLPNAVGLLVMNYIAVISLTSYSFIHPMILVVIFIMGFITRKKSEGEQPEKASPVSLAGSIACVLGIIGFQIV
ncbi:MAG: hypothetical protein ACI4KM_04065 [Oscillospiraceae bacterium]